VVAGQTLAGQIERATTTLTPRRTASLPTPDGWMFFGSQESLRDLGPQFTPQQHCRATCYRPNRPAAPVAAGIR
jgi:hypothetical protein